MNVTDGELLQRYARDHSEAAFTELVQRHINLIYSAALRQVNGHPQLAEDVTQAVFTDLARKAAQLTRHPSLTGWLYTSTRFIAANIRRTEQRRSAREQEAHAMNAFANTLDPEPDWAQIRPLLDDAMHTLDAQDREAVLLRHFEHRSFAEIGERLGLAENTARMRVNRALEKLQETLRKRGVTSTALALAGLLTANGVGAAPAHLAARMARTALAATATGGTTALLTQLFTMTKIKLAAAAALLAAGVVLFTVSNHRASSAPSAGTTPAVASLAASPSPADPASLAAASTTNAPLDTPPAAAPVTNGFVLHLQIVAADSGQPIPHVPIDYRGWAGGKFKGRKLMSSRLGICDVVYPTNITELELTTREDDFADTQLLWRPPNGDVIPTNYVLRLDRPVPIGGRVVDADGNPVAGALVGWNHQDSPADLKLPQNHAFSWIEVSTDNDGRWRINRIGADMISRIYGSARDSNYVDSSMIFTAQDKTAEAQLRAETHVFQLGRALTAKGIVVDENGMAIPDAKILVGQVGFSGSRTGKAGSDGTFAVQGCAPGKQLVTASAKGYAATTVEANLAPDSEPIRLMLQAGKILRLRVVDKNGQPIPKAQIYHESMRDVFNDASGSKDPQVEFSPKTDAEGRAVWTNAPDVEMAFDAMATGYVRSGTVTFRPDGEEHTITLEAALVVHGSVLDESTGQPIPHFRIVEGGPEFNPISGQTNARWSTIDRFWLDFANGTYRKSLEESVIGGEKNPGYILKFIAEGYAPFISRVIGPDEGDVQLDVTLRPAAETTVLVYKPDGQLAANADIGLVSHGSHLNLVPGGFSRVYIQSGGSLLQTGADGSFKLPADDSLLRVIAASTDGYASALPSALTANPVIQLQPWGGLEVNCLAGGQPDPGREYLLELDGGSPDTVSFDFQGGHLISDAQGRISISKLPPGNLNLIRLHPTTTDGGMGWMHGNRTPFQIRSSETTTLNLDTNYIVTARLQWPAGVTRSPQWRVFAGLVPVEPGQTAAPITAVPNSKAYPTSVRLDDTVTTQDVPPGNYTLSVSFYTLTGSNAPPLFVPNFEGTKIVASGNLNVTVPSDPPSGNINVGDVQLQTTPDSPQ